MPNIHETPDDDPNVPASNIVGQHWKEGRVYYEGRPQGPKVAAKSESELIARLTQAQRNIIREQGGVVDIIYPNNNAWELRIFQ